MTTILHLSDPHFGAEVRAVVEAMLEAAHRLQPDIVILTGDLTQRARRKQFRAAADFVNRLAGRAKVIIPGNHDIPLFNLPARLLTPYGGYHRAFGLKEGVWHDDEIAIVGFDTTSVWRPSRGRLPPTHLQRKMLRATGQATRPALVIACVHQPLATAWQADRGECLIDAERSARQCAELGIDILLSGHVHVPLVATTEQAFAALPRHFVLSGAGTATSYRTRAGVPNSFNLLQLELTGAGAAVSIAQHVFDAIQTRFVAQPATSFVRGANGWRQSSDTAR